ncbi:LPS-assembly protein LptD [Pigmentiphaga soli]|uniref:LPS-assembly protein LptD n=1 Tax=Pigmentiphaga soli TaxID=1007095 RepID=A0ABP8HKZ0_9BURK
MQVIRWFSVVAATVAAPLACAQGSPPPQASAPAPLGGQGLRLSPSLQERPARDPDSLPVFLEGDSLKGEGQENYRLDGNAQVRRADVILKADSIEYHQVENDLEAQGNVRLLREGNLITGPRLKLNLGSGVGEVEQPHFRFVQTGSSGTADRLELLGQNRLRALGVRYSGCTCEQPDWWVKATQLDLDYNAGEATGRNGVLYFKGVPILASPLISFPLNDARKSGFLSPTFGITSKTGPEFMLPYYFNIAPNRDATLTPKYMARRGLQLGGEFRYLEPRFSGETRLTYLPDDAVYKDDRYLFSSQHRQQLTDTLGFNWNYSRASDDAYFRDLSALGTGLSTTATLEQSFALTWHSGYWDAYARSIRYQTLQDPLAPIVPPYDRSPQFHLTGARYDWGGFDVRFEADATRFVSPDSTQVSGTRLYAYPSVSYPIVRPGGFFIPKIGIHSTHYDIQSFQGNPSTDPSRTLPIMSVDTGLIFERDSNLLGQAVKQTLEPRLFYLRVPYRDQSQLPVFDTALADFNFAQIFSENLFAGSDRIAEANQLTAALTSRWLDPKTGVERARITGAQRLYFSDQRVTLPGMEPSSDGRSDFLVSVYGALTSTLSGETTVQYNPKISRISRSTVGARWNPARLSTISLAYRYKREAYEVPGQEQVDIAFQWPIAPRWFAIGRFDYSLLENRIAESVAGFEYSGGCCYAVRVVAQRYAVARNNATTAMFVQLELTGFGGIGASPLMTLRRSIPGYESINPPPPPGSVFQRYE